MSKRIFRIFFLIAFVMTLFSMTHCSTRNDALVIENCADGIKNQDEIGVDCGGICDQKCPPSMSAVVDGSGWKADEEKISSSFVQNSSTLQISGSPSGSFYPRIQLVYVGELKFGTFPLHSNTSFLSDLSSFVQFDSGSITFTLVDTRNRLLSGSFSFSCTDNSSGTVHNITSGVFELVGY